MYTPNRKILELRLYQIVASDYAMIHAVTILAMCPNGGKTEIAIDVIRRWLLLNPGKKVLVLAHSTKVLKDNFITRLDSLNVDFTYSAVFDKNADVHIALPNSKHHFINNDYGFVVVDEAHQNYLADRVQEIMTVINPDKQLLLTGTPSKFIKVGGYNIFFLPINEIDEKWFAKLQVELVSSSYSWDEDLEVKGNFFFSKKETNKTLENIILKLIERVKIKLSAEQFNNPSFWSKTKSWAFAYKSLGKTMIVCKRIEQAQQVYKILLKNGVNATISETESDKDSINIVNFKNNEHDVLVVVDRARLGFSDDSLYNIIDMSGTLDPDIIHQMYCRVLRGTPDMYKYYLKVTSQKPGLMDVTTAVVNASLMLTDRRYLSTYNGFNFKGLTVFRIKGNAGGTRDGGTRGPGGGEPIFPEYTKDTINLVKNILHNLDNPLSIYKLTTLGDVRYELGLLTKIIHSKERTLEIAKNYTGTSFSADYMSEYEHACKNNYLDELRIILRTPTHIKHSKKRTLEIAKNYTGKSFGKDYPNEYAHARLNNYLDELSIILGNKSDIIHSKERTLEIAKNYTGKNFSKDYIAEYKHARKNNYLDELKIILRTPLYIKHSKERTLEIAKNYTGKSFSKDHMAEYNHAIVNNYLNELNVVLGKIISIIQHSKERTFEIAKNYTGKNFKKDYPNEYAHAYRNKYLNELNIVLRKIIPIIQHSKERTLEIAKNYTGKNFAKDYVSEYTHAYKNNYLDELNKILGKIIFRHSKERTLEIARNYTGTSFAKDNMSEYNHARKNNYLDELYQILKTNNI